jgi:hypothetical protein
MFRRRAFDVSLGPDSRGHVVALYTRCRSAGQGCDIVRREPLPGVALKLLRDDDINEEGSYLDTGVATTTAADGRWSFMPVATPQSALYLVTAPLLGLASSPAASP